MSVRSVLSVYHAGGQTWDVDPMSVYCWPTVYDAEPTLAQYWATVSCLTTRGMWASVKDGGPTLTQLLFKASYGIYSQHEVGLPTTVECILASTGDPGPTLLKLWFIYLFILFGASRKFPKLDWNVRLPTHTSSNTQRLKIKQDNLLLIFYYFSLFQYLVIYVLIICIIA